MLTLLIAAASLVPFSLPNMNAAKKIYNSAEHRNAVFVIEAFFDGCHYCHENSRNVHDLVEFYKTNSRVQVLDVGIDTRDMQYDSWIRQTNPLQPVLNDSNRKLIGQLGTRGFPSTYVLNCKGEVVTQTEGVWGNTARSQLSSAVESALGVKCEDDEPKNSRVFAMESANLTIRVVLRPENSTQISDDKDILKRFLR